MYALKNIIAGAGIAAAAIAAAGQPAFAAKSASGYVTTSVNLRAGPGTNYPVVTTMHAGDGITVYGCTSGWSWCDINWHGNRGWAAGQYLQVNYQSHRRPIGTYGARVSLPSVTFSIGNYWGNHYRGRKFYGEMNRFGGRHDGPPPSRTSTRTQPPMSGPQMHRSGPMSGPQMHRSGPMQPDNRPHCKPGEHFVNGACR